LRSSIGLRRRSAPSSSSRACATSTAWLFVSGRGAAVFIAGAELEASWKPLLTVDPNGGGDRKTCDHRHDRSLSPAQSDSDANQKKAEQRPTRKDDPLGFEHYLFRLSVRDPLHRGKASILALGISESSVQSWLFTWNLPQRCRSRGREGHHWSLGRRHLDMWSSLLQHPRQQLFKLGKIGILRPEISASDRRCCRRRPV